MVGGEFVMFVEALFLKVAAVVVEDLRCQHKQSSSS